MAMTIPRALLRCYGLFTLAACEAVWMFPLPATASGPVECPRAQAHHPATRSEVVISGTGYASPHLNHPLIKVIALEETAPGDTARLDSTFTDDTGYYDMNFLMTGTDPRTGERGISIAGNPYASAAMINLGVAKAGNYALRVFDAATGIKILDSQLPCQSGENQIILEGLGQPGLKIVNITNGDISYTRKIIQTAANHHAPGARLNTAPTLKSAHISSDIILRFEPQEPGYCKHDTIVPITTSLVNYVLQAIPVIHSFQIKPQDVHGNLALDYELKITWKDQSTTQHTLQNEFLDINRTEYPPLVTDTAIFLGDTILNPEYLAWTIGTPMVIDQNQPNLYVNPKEETPGNGTYLPPPPTPVILSNLPAQSKLWLIPTQVPDPANPGNNIRMDDIRVRRMICRGPPGSTTKFGRIPQVTDTLDIVQFTFNETFLTPIPIAQLDRAQAELEKILAAYQLPNDQLLAPHRFFRIIDFNDPRWLTIMARGYDQLAYTTFDQSTPENIIALINTYTYNNTVRMKNSSSRYDIAATNGVIFAEIYQQMTCTADPGAQGITPQVYGPDGQMTILGKTMLRAKALFQFGVNYW